MKRDLQSPALRGLIEIAAVDAAGNRRIVQRDRNTTTYEGMDALGMILAGQIDAHFNGLYFGFDSAGVAGAVVTSATTVAADFHALAGTQDVARVRLGTHTTDNSGAEYSDNRVLVSGVADAGITGELRGEILTGGTAKITHFGLIVAEDWDDYTKDKVYAVFTPSSAVLVPSNGGIAVRWRPFFTVVA